MSVEKFCELHIVSDLHLGGINVNGKNLQIFNQGTRLANFIKNITIHRPGDRIGLVLNGDIVDFLAESPACYLDTEKAIQKLERVYTDPAFSSVWETLSAFIAQPRRQLIIVLGNHDVELALPPVRTWLMDKLSGGNDERKGRITYATDGAGHTCEVGGKCVLCVHGNEVDSWNVVDYFSLLKVSRSLNRGQKPAEWDANAGTRLVIDVMNEIKRKYPFVDLLKPEKKAAIPIVAALDPGQASKAFTIAGCLNRQSEDASKIDRGLLAVNLAQTRKANSNELIDLERLMRYTFGELDERDGSVQVSALLSSAYRDIERGIDPKKAQDMDEELLSLGDSLNRVMEWFERLAEKVSAKELLRIALKSLLRNDDTFNLEGMDEIYEKLKDRVGPDVHYVIAGHTHLARVKERQPGRYYFNSGTWIRLIELTDSMLENEEFSRIYETIKGKNGEGSSMDALDTLNDLGPDRKGSLIKKETNYAVSIINENGQTYGQIGLVEASGSLQALENTRR